MTRYPGYVRAMAIGLVFLFATPERVPAEVWDEVAAAIGAADYQRAIVALEAAAEQDPNDYQVQRVLGVCLLELGRLKQAEDHLRAAILLEPDTSAARYHLAQVLALRGNIEEATELLREIIRLAPESGYAARAARVLPGLEQLKETLLVQDAPKRWDLYLRVAGEYDDNVPARSRHDPQDGTHSLRLVTSVRVAYRFPDQRLDAPWPTLEAGYSYYRSVHDKSAFRDFDVSSHNANLELSRYGYVFGRWTKLGVTGSFGHTELGEEKFNEDIGVEAAWTVQLRPAFLAVLGYGMHWKEFENDTEFPEFFSRDGHEQEARLDTYTYLFQNRLILGLGYAYLWNDVDGSQFGLNRHSVRASATVSLPAKLRLYTSVTYATEDYDEFTPDPRREDDRITAYLSLSRSLWSDAWRAEVYGTYSTSDSNQDFADYDRAVYGIAVSWSP